MTAAQLLQYARDLDADIMALDRRYVIARVNHAAPLVLQRMEAHRNDLVREWAAAWQTRPVSQS